MTTTTLAQLKRRYPYMFAGPDIGISVPRGWMPIFEKLCEDIDFALGTDKRKFHFTQCKEKFGVARWSWKIEGGRGSVRVNVISEKGEVLKSWTSPRENVVPVPIDQQIDDLVQKAIGLTRHACIACGEPGGMHQEDGGWMLTLCERHARDVKAGKRLDIWFGEEDQ